MLRYFPAERRRRLAPLFLGAGLLVVGKLAYDETPRDQELRYLLPSPVHGLRVTYSDDEELYGGIERRFPEGSPRELVHTPQLAPGRYRVAIELTQADGTITHLTRSVLVPSEGSLRIPLTEER